MRRRDLLPVGLLLGLMTFVGAQLYSAPRARSIDDSAEQAADLESQRAVARRILAFEAPSTYAGHLLGSDSLVVRWEDRSEPLRVYIEPAVEIDGWRQRRLSDAQIAFRTWEKLVPLRFVFVASAADAELMVRWTSRFPERDKVGNSSLIRDERGRIMTVTITLAVHDANGMNIRDEVAAVTALHEVGHSLGINHSPNTGDLMAARYTGAVRELSAADKATVQLWYRLPPGSIRRGAAE